MQLLAAIEFNILSEFMRFKKSGVVLFCIQHKKIQGNGVMQESKGVVAVIAHG